MARRRQSATTGQPRARIERSVVLYDEDCGFCRWSLAWILRWDRSARLRPVPIQSEEGGRLLAGIAPELRLDSWHLITGDGTLFSAGAALEPLARVLPGGRPLAVALRAFPGLTEAGYRYVARHRDRWARVLRLERRSTPPRGPGTAGRLP